MNDDQAPGLDVRRRMVMLAASFALVSCGGGGGSPAPTLPYRFRGLARLANDLLDELGYRGQVDAIGVSWGGALAQTFAFHFPDRCRRLILAATSPGVIMVPGKLSVLMKLANAF